MMIKVRFLVLVVLNLVLAVSCDNLIEDVPELKFEIPRLSRSTTTLKNTLNKNVSALSAGTPPYAPADVSQFDCVLVNVVGEGIGNWEANSDRVGVGRNFSYLGTYSRLVSTSTGGTIAMKIKKGSLRYIQLIGVNSQDNTCPANVTASDLNSYEKFPGMFIIGSVEKDIFKNETISIRSTYAADSTADIRGNEDEPWYEGGTNNAPEAGVLTLSKLSNSSIKVDWTSATDDQTSSGQLLYKLVYSTISEEIDSIDEVDLRDSNVLVNWENASTATATSLSLDTQYFFSLMVKDAGGMKTLYTMASLTLTDTSCSCPDGKYPKEGSCVDSDIGYWASQCIQTQCTNSIPTNSSYTGGNSTSTCGYTCNTGYTQSNGACVPVLPGGTNFGCASTDAIVGYNIWHSSEQVTGLQVICRQNNSGSPNGSNSTGMSMGSTTGTANSTFTCANQKGVVKINFENDLENLKLLAIKFTCEKRNASGGTSQELSSIYGQTTSSVSSNINCPDVTTYMNSVSVSVSGGKIVSVDENNYCK